MQARGIECYNIDCQGFVQVYQEGTHILGKVLSPTSIIGAFEKVVLVITITQVILFDFFYIYQIVYIYHLLIV